MDPFVDDEWLRAHRNEVVLVDIRFYLDGRSGRAAYEAGHLPGAVYVELEEVLSEPHPDDDAGRHPLPTPERFAAGLSAVGIGDSDTVVAYDDAGGVIAARLVWMLRATGHRAALLDGGIGVTPTDRLETGRGPASPPAPAPFSASPWPLELLAEIDEVAAAADAAAVPVAIAGAVTTSAPAGGSATVLIDARDRARFDGGRDPVDPRSGHIPGARCVPTREHLDHSGRIASPEQLRATFAAAGIADETPVISYCGSGVTACHNLLALERAGHTNARLFAGSWSQWSRDPARAVATGED